MRRLLVGIIMIIIMVVSIFIYNSKNNLSVKTVYYNGNNLRISVDGVEATTLPTSGNYYLVDYTCKSSDTIITWDREIYLLDVSNRNKKGEVSCYLDFQSKPKLADMEVGSYVAYTGNNGCVEESCNGQNANYESDLKMGYCISSNYKFTANGWRIGYKKNGSAYLISAGSTDCMCSNSDGTSSSSNCSTYLTSTNLYMHIDNMDNISQKYCNKGYAKDGVCNKTTAWAMDVDDYNNIIGKTLSSCSSKYSDKTCGYTNDLIDNGGYYWFATAYNASSKNTFLWGPGTRRVYNTSSLSQYGVRPVLYLESSVLVVGGSGTYEDPYQIANNSFLINSGSNYVGVDEKNSVELSLVGNDVSTMCISVNSSECSNYVSFSNTYTLDLSGEEDGKKIIYVYYKDGGGNIIASMTRSIILDTTAPTNSSVTIGDGAGLSRILTTASTDASSMCFSNTSSDASSCTNWVDYATSYRWRLSDGTGSKTVYAFFKDEAGNISSTTATVEVTSIVDFSINEDFLDSTYDGNITIINGENYAWYVSNGKFISSNKGVKSSTSSSTIQFTPDVDAIMSFDYGVSSESTYDKLTITLIGSDSSSDTLVKEISGVSSGSKTDVYLTAGVTYELVLSYTKDSTTDKNDDIGYIDNLVINS